MSPYTQGAIVFACVYGAALLAMRLRATLPPPHLSDQTKETVKLAMGLVATMAALVLGLLVASTKGAYDAQKNAVIQIAGKAVVLDRVLAVYGPDAAEARTSLRRALEGAITHIWPENKSQQAELAPNTASGEATYEAI